MDMDRVAVSQMAARSAAIPQLHPTRYANVDCLIRLFTRTHNDANPKRWMYMQKVLWWSLVY